MKPIPARLLRLISLFAFVCAAAQTPPPPPPLDTSLDGGVKSEASFTVSNAVAVVQDVYGYEIDTNAPMNWVDARAGKRLAVSSLDDGSASIPLPFSFPFYETTYSPARQDWIYISVNGYLTISDAQTYDNDYRNLPIPYERKPNNLIAPFWDDLVLATDIRPEAGVYTLQGVMDGKKFLAVEWFEVSKWGEPEVRLTFEVLLFEDGRIRFQYYTLDGALDSATVGIEDSVGTDGWQYAFDNPVLAAGDALEFRRPAPAPHARFSPPFQSQFVPTGTVQLPIMLQNIGALGSDTFDLSLALPAGWSARFCLDAQCKPLADSNKNGAPDTGPLAFGQSLEFFLLVSPPAGARPGDFAEIALRADSTRVKGPAWQSRIRLVVPVAFAQAFIDPRNGTRQFLTSSKYLGLTHLSETFQGRSLAMSATPRGDFFAMWEWHAPNSTDMTLQWTLLDSLGQPMLPVSTLDGHSTLTAPIVNDHDPYLASLPDGTLAAVFVRDQIRADNAVNSNVILFVRKPAGGWLQINLTKNTAWYTGSASTAPIFMTPSITANPAAGAPGFGVSWVRRQGSGASFLSEVGFAAVDPLGKVSASRYPLPALNVATAWYSKPLLTALPNGQLFLALAVHNDQFKRDPVHFAVLNWQGTLLRSLAPVSGANGDQLDAAVLGTDGLLLTWRDPDYGLVAFTTLTIGTFVQQHAPVHLNPDEFHSAMSVSVTAINSSQAVLTWMDAIDNRCLYYALVNRQGQIITAPFVFMHSQGDRNYITTSGNGQGNSANLRAYRLFTPTIRR